MKNSNLTDYPHRRLNILTGEWVLCSPHRTKRPWQGEQSETQEEKRPEYDPECYLCPGNVRANGERNPDYKTTFVFTNDFSALLEETPEFNFNEKDLLVARGQKGICRVVNFSPRHDLTLAEMNIEEIENVITVWQNEFELLGSKPFIKYVQIFENKGKIMGNSNPHPHCQIWAQEEIPNEPLKELKQFKKYFHKNKRTLLQDYIKLELRKKERLVYSNESFVALVPFWAVWPYETLIVSRRPIANILQFRKKEKKDFADILKTITTKYDNLFKISFPYSAGLHQAQTDGKDHKEWHFHMHFYPPLLRSATVKKFMVGYEMLAEPQRDITPEYSSEILRNLPVKHYKEIQ
ncbi:UDP-glucose--hexose-1-phosphate uridylyltransferase [Melioribacter sp. OK-6-Me]|uniref:UDP-glucose--hexose-1-phosphate uridylyltransferase n=1 Tax=unclassified Melioribacter TaxID=2627329 RepID=UPI003ED96EEB